jgi:glycogen(starch) synthase
MNERGINTLYGRWLIEGAPRVLLFDTGSAYQFLNEWKGDLWNISGIPGPDSDHESNEAIVFGYLIAWFLGEVSIFGGPMTNPARANQIIVCLS